MDFWNHKVNVSEEAARLQINIVKGFPAKKRMKIALDFANMGIQQTRTWIKKSNPYLSDLEVNLEFVRIMYFETGEMPDSQWSFFKKKMDEKIKKDWSNRFRKMMKDKNWDYTDIAKMGHFKNGKVIEATISRGLPSFAKLAVVIHEQQNQNLEKQKPS